MLYSEFLKRLNKGMLIKGYRIISSGSEQELADRAALIEEYTRVVKDEDGTLVGVKPMPVQERDKIVIHWEYSVLKQHDGRMYASGPYTGALVKPVVESTDLDAMFVRAEV